jgi:TonB-linked SusC/RagA family outer membrane protein
MKKLILKQKNRTSHYFNLIKMTVLLLCFFATTPLFAQNAKVNGVVTDKNGEPVIGASVVIKNSLRGTVTDVNGTFSLEASDQAVLKISYIGYTDLEVKADTEKRMRIILEESDNTLDEVVVVGFGTQKKVNLTGAVSTVNAKMLEDRPVSNTLQALQGAVPGLNIINTSGGGVDKQSTFNIRGIGTIGDSKGDPLVMIDGMEGDIHTLNPQDIDNISFLKDAAASSIYGSRAPFGVILITTKKGKTGKPKVSYDGNFRSNSPILLPDMVDSYTFALVFNGVENAEMRFSDEWLQRIKDFQDGKIPMNTFNGKQYPMTTVAVQTANGEFTGDWASGYSAGVDNVNPFKELYKSSSFAQEHNLTVSGGTDNVSYYLSGNYMDAPGLMKLGGDRQDRTGINAKLDAKINDKISVSYGAKFIRSKFEQPSSGKGRWDFWLVSQGWPMLPVYDPNGFVFDSPSSYLEIVQGGRENNMNDRVYQQFGTIIEPVKNWKIFGNYNFSLTENFNHTDRQKLYLHDIYGNPQLKDGNTYVVEDVNRTNYYNVNIYSEYSKSFFEHNFKIMAGFQSELFKYRNSRVQKSGILNPENPTIESTSGLDADGKTIAPDVRGGYANWASAGYFGRLNYNYKGRYLVELNLRYDGSSRFREDKRWNWLPSASAGWNIAQETFWENLQQYVGIFKLRGSYGVLGNMNTNSVYPTYSSLPVSTSGGSWIVDGKKPNTASYPTLVSTLLTWEKIKTYNMGVDLSFLNNRLNASFDYFTRYTNDMVGPAVELPATYGVSTSEIPRTNNTDLKTQGFEVDLAWQDRLSNGLNYNVRFILSDDQTTILKYPNPGEIIGYQNDGTGHIYYDKYYAGEKYGNIWGYETVGIAKTQEEMDAHLATLPNGGQSAFLYGKENGWGAGDIMYMDLNNDGKIDAGSNTVSDPGDRKVIGNITPRFKFGVDLGADWKGFDLRVFFQGVMKRDYFNTSYMFWGIGRSIWESTVLKEHMDYFRDDPNDPFGVNLDGYYPRLSTPENWDSVVRGKNKAVQTRYLQNAAYIRLKNLTLGYVLPKEILNKISIEKIRVYVSGENLWTGTKLAKIFDPETIDNPTSTAYPLNKTYSIGINITF